MKEKSHVLVVDDEPMILNSLRNLLMLEYTVHTAEKGSDALRLLSEYPIKVLMTDQRMPEMLGHEILREAKKLSPNTIRVLLTGYSDLEAIMNSVNAGEVFRYINKPWRADTILSVFRLGVKLYDEISTLATAGKTNDATHPRSVHIEVEEKHLGVMFVGYENSEVQGLAKQYENRYDISLAGNTDDALKEIVKKPISVIVSDVRFDDEDAISFLNTIRAEYPHIVTVILTEVVDAELAIRSINELNVFRYLVKPVETSEFGDILKEASLKSSLFKSTPRLNIHETAMQAARSKSIEESTMRLKLRAAQAMLLKGENKDQS